MSEDRSAWLAERRTGIGGSDVHHLFDAEPYGCKRRLWLEKRGVEPDYPETPSDVMQRGTKLEDLVADLYAEKTGRTLERRPAMVSAEDPWMRVNVDRVIVGEPRGEGALEVKTHNFWVFRKVKQGGLMDAHILQLQHALYVGGYQWGAYAVLHPDTWQLLRFDVERDDALIARMREAAAAFWRTVEHGPMPEPLPSIDDRCKSCPWRRQCRGEALLAAAGPMDHAGEAIVLDRDDDLATVAADYLEAKRMEADATATVELVAQALKAKLGEREAVDTDGARIYFRRQIAQRVDTKMLRAKYAAIAKECETPTPSRPLRVIPI